MQLAELPQPRSTLGSKNMLIMNSINNSRKNLFRFSFTLSPPLSTFARCPSDRCHQSKSSLSLFLLFIKSAGSDQYLWELQLLSGETDTPYPTQPLSDFISIWCFCCARSAVRILNMQITHTIELRITSHACLRVLLLCHFIYLQLVNIYLSLSPSLPL